MMAENLSFEKNNPLAQGSRHPQDASQVTVDIVRTMDELNQAFALRREAFIQGKGVSDDIEFEGNDFASTHVLMKVNGIPAGTLRIRCFKEFAKMERLCVSEKFRGQGLYKHLLGYTEDYLKDKGYSCFVGYILKELTDYWCNRGFVINPDMDVVQKDALTLVPVVYPFRMEPRIAGKHRTMNLLAREGRAHVIEQ